MTRTYRYEHYTYHDETLTFIKYRRFPEYICG